MRALTGKARHREVEIIDRVSPQYIWQAVAQSPLQFVLVGESRHALNCTRHALADGIDALATGGVRHLGLEYHRAQTQPLLDRFSQLSGGGPAATLRRMSLLRGLGNRALVAWEMPAYWHSMHRLLRRASGAGMKLHALDDIELRRPPREMWEKANAVRERTEARYRQAVSGELKLPPSRLPPGVRVMLEGHQELQAVLTEGYYQRRQESDGEHAKRLMQVAGADRAALYFGHQHCRGGPAPGIGYFLPSDQQIYVALGTGGYLLNQFEDEPYPARLPDFVIMADRGEGIVTRQAVERGLWRSPAP